MEFRIIKSPSESTVDILIRRMGPGKDKNSICVDAIGLVQGQNDRYDLRSRYC